MGRKRGGFERGLVGRRRRRDGRNEDRKERMKERRKGEGRRRGMREGKRMPGKRWEGGGVY